MTILFGSGIDHLIKKCFTCTGNILITQTVLMKTKKELYEYKQKAQKRNLVPKYFNKCLNNAHSFQVVLNYRGHNEGFLRIIICVLADIKFKQEIQYQIKGFAHVNTNF